MSVSRTGRRRFRLQRRLFRDDVLVLQVELSGREVVYFGGSCSSENVCYWRDARITDLTVAETPP